MRSLSQRWSAARAPAAKSGPSTLEELLLNRSIHRLGRARGLAATLSAAISLALPGALNAMLGSALLVPAAAQAAERVVGSGRTATEARKVGDFEAISLNGSIDVTVRQGAETSVSATADDNLLPMLETIVEAGPSGPSGARLVVRWKSGTNLSTRNKVQVQIVTPRLVALGSAGSGDARIESFNTPSLKLSLAGSGDAALPGLRAEELQISIAGSGDVKADGQAARLKITIAGSGDVMARELRADDVSVRIAGSGDAAVQAQKKLAVSIAGSGDVIYVGDAEVTRSVVGSGSVKRH